MNPAYDSNHLGRAKHAVSILPLSHQGALLTQALL